MIGWDFSNSNITSKRIIRLLNIAKNEALKSNFKFKMSAVIFKHNNILSTGRNYGCRSKQGTIPEYQRWPGSIHAEMDAILNCENKIINNASILIVRLTTNNNFNMAKPCDLCMNYLEKFNFKKVIYTLDKQPYIEIIER
jgi:deoxycytidylate deaminase